MAGKMCTGKATANAMLPRNSRAYCEGVQYRSLGTALAFPASDNPQPAGSEAFNAWDTGWNVTDAAAGGVVDPADVPCCAAPLNTIAA